MKRISWVNVGLSAKGAEISKSILRALGILFLAGAWSSVSYGQSAAPDAATQPASVSTAQPVQTTDAATAPSGSAASQTQETGSQLQKVVVKGVAPEANILPIRPTTSVTGIEATVKDTPRSITEISREQLKNDVVTDSQALAKYAPGVTANFTNGIASAPYIRGQAPDIYQNGIRTDRGWQAMVPFQTNAIDGIDLVAGPASVIFGPSASTSGYINEITKQPYFDKNRTEVDLTFGDFHIGGQSNPDFIQTVDNSGPISKNLAYRVSVSTREGNSFYGNNGLTGDPQNSQNVYVDLTWMPNPDITIDNSVQYNNYDYATTRGWNRVNQNLINNGTYIAGSATPILELTSANGVTAATAGAFKLSNGTYAVLVAPTYVGSTGANPTGFSSTSYRTVSLGDASGAAPVLTSRQVTIGNASTITTSAVTGASTGVALSNGTTITNAKPATIAGYVLEAPGAGTGVHDVNIRQDQDYTNGDQERIRQWVGQSLDTFNVSDDLTIFNNFYFESYNGEFRQLVQSGDYLYNDYVAEDRTEFRLKEDYNFLGLNIEHDSNTGFDMRFSQNEYNFQGVAITDNSDITNPNTLSGFGVYGTSMLVPGTPAYADATGPQHYDPTPYGDIKVTAPAYAISDDPGYVGAAASSDSSWIRTIGFYSQHQFKFNDQWTFLAGGRFSVLSDSTQSPAVDLGLPTVTDTETAIIPAWNASLTYKPAPWVTTYFTYDYTQALNANDEPTLAGGELGTVQFHSVSNLFEGGAKFEVIPNKLFTSVAAYYQERQLAPVSVVNADGSTSTYIPNIQARGVEAQLQYQPDKHWTINANYTWMQSNYVKYVLQGGSKPPYGGVTEGQENAGGTSDTGYVFGDAAGGGLFQQMAQGNYAESLLPHNVFNLSAAYTLDMGLGLQADLWVHDTWRYFMTDNINIPAEYNLDLTLFYAPPNQTWRAQVTVMNVTNQFNFQPNGAESVQDFIDPLPPLGVQGKFSYIF